MAETIGTDVAGAGRPGVRVSDEERARVAERIATAQAEGRLDLAEYDERVRAAYAAVVRADLDRLTGDLPASPAGAPGSPGAAPAPARRSGAAAAVGVWATVSALNLAIWMAVSLAAAEPVYPWWIWVAGPWGVMLAIGSLVGRARCAGPGSSDARAPQTVARGPQSVTAHHDRSGVPIMMRCHSSGRAPAPWSVVGPCGRHPT